MVIINYLIKVFIKLFSLLFEHFNIVIKCWNISFAYCDSVNKISVHSACFDLIFMDFL